MKKVLFRLSAILILAGLMAGMILPMSVFAAGTSEEITNSLGAYPYPYPLEGNRLEYCGWNQKVNAANSVWFNDSESSLYPLKEKTNGYYEGWSTSNPVTTGTYHKYGVGMHSAIIYAPSTVYAIDYYKMTSFYTKVFLVQYDYCEEQTDYDPAAAADPANPADGEKIPVEVYIDRSVDGKTWSVTDETTGAVTYPNRIVKTLNFKGDAVEFSLDAQDLEGFSHIKIGVATKHGIYEEITEGEGEEATTRKELVGNSALASVYFADLTITQSEEVPVITAPSIPMRPTTEPAQADAYEVIKTPETDENNWYGKPYGAWMAGSNDKYFLSDMTYLEASNTPTQTYASGQPTTVNKPYATADGTPFLFGAEGMEHEITNGIGMHPKNPRQPVIGRTDSWTIYDISAYTAEDSETPADTFYTLVGLTAGANDWGSRLSSAGVYVYIYGDKTGDGEHYELLAASELVKGFNLGEFNVNIEGVKLLLVDIIMTETATNHSYSAIGFGDACLFRADEEAVKPDYSGERPHDDYCWDNSVWIPYSDTEHKMTCDCGEKTMYYTHTWSAGVITMEPTHEQTGIRTYTCYDCGHQKTETIEKIPHEWSTVWIIEDETQHKHLCTCGEIEYFDHVYTDDNDRFCNDCGYQRTLSDTPTAEPSDSTTPEPDDSTAPDSTDSTAPATDENTSSELDNQVSKALEGCKSTVSLGAGLTFLLSIGAAGVLLKKKED